MTAASSIHIFGVEVHMLHRITRALAFALGAALLGPALAIAQDTAHMHQPGLSPDSNRIGVMSPMVLEQRLKMLGYTDVVVIETRRNAVLANTLKANRPVAVKLDPYTGKVVELRGKLELRRQGARLIRPDGAVVAPPR